MIKTFTGTTFVGIESLYKPQGYPSFELLAYVVDSDLKTIKKVLKDNSISTKDIFACGDIKQIYSRKVHQAIKIEREAAQKQQGGYGHYHKGDKNVFYEGPMRTLRRGTDDRDIPFQPLNQASTRDSDENSNDPKYYGIDN